MNHVDEYEFRNPKLLKIACLLLGQYIDAPSMSEQTIPLLY